MDEIQARQVVERYRVYLSLTGDKAENAPFDHSPTREEALRHLLEMCDEIDRYLDKIGTIDSKFGDQLSDSAWEDLKKLQWLQGKVNRWLGFMQGVLWAQGSFTLNELRQHNAPDCEPK